MIHSVEYEKLTSEDKRLSLAEERTVLSYVRTFLTLLGLMVIFIKIYFEQGGWGGAVVSFGVAVAATLIIHQFVQYKHSRKQKRKIEIKINSK